MTKEEKERIRKETIEEYSNKLMKKWNKFDKLRKENIEVIKQYEDLLMDMDGNIDILCGNDEEIMEIVDKYYRDECPIDRTIIQDVIIELVERTHKGE